MKLFFLEQLILVFWVSLVLLTKDHLPWNEEDKHLIGHDVVENVSIDFEVLFPKAFYNFS